VASIVIWFVDVEKGREDCREFERERKVARVQREAVVVERPSSFE